MTRNEAEQGFADAIKRSVKAFANFSGDPWACPECNGDGSFIRGRRGRPMDEYYECDCDECGGTGLNESWDISSEEWEEDEDDSEDEDEDEDEETRSFGSPGGFARWSNPSLFRK